MTQVVVQGFVVSLRLGITETFPSDILQQKAKRFWQPLARTQNAAVILSRAEPVLCDEHNRGNSPFKVFLDEEKNTHTHNTSCSEIHHRLFC